MLDIITVSLKQMISFQSIQYLFYLSIQLTLLLAINQHHFYMILAAVTDSVEMPYSSTKRNQAMRATYMNSGHIRVAHFPPLKDNVSTLICNKFRGF